VTAERAPAPAERFIVYPALVNAARILARRPLRLALGAAASAATAAAVAGVVAGPAPATTMAGSEHLASYTSAVSSTRQGGHWSAVGSLSATSAAAAHSAAQQHAVPFQTAGAAQQGGSSQPAASAHPTTAVSQAAAPAAQPSAPASPPPAPPPPPQPFLIYDSVTPSALPTDHAVATYANGSYAASPSQLAGHGHVLWIDTNGSDPNASVLDVEPGDATPQQAAAWAAQKLSSSPNSTAIIYTMRSEWGAVQSAIAQLPWWMPSHTKYWIADPTGVDHVVPGSQATQWYWGQSYDISTAMPNSGF
jgi:hypothetical protein